MSDSGSAAFCPVSFTFLSEVVDQGDLKFKSDRTGNIYDATPINTLVANEETEQISASKFRRTLIVTAEDPTNPRQRVPDGCDNCGRKVVSYQRLGSRKIVFYKCLCGNEWHN
jgi:DNA-directed RNA polymerase subunit M/transcription elongation factor TFIIS